MKISIGADHAGFSLKEQLRAGLAAEGHELIDRGTSSEESTDYPDYAVPVGEDVASGRAERGILVCCTGIGMTITANKVNGVRAALAINSDAVRLTRQHNDANVLAVAAKYTSVDQALDYVRLFLSTDFEGGRHARRVEKINSVETTEK
jgi:ribose 5-phosphate isomerase B